MKTNIENSVYDTEVEASDWRYSAAIVGLHRYLLFYKGYGVNFDITDEKICFNRSDITEERYLEFAENYYGNEFPHRRLELKLGTDEYKDEDISAVNELLKSNSVMKKVFGKLKFDGHNQEEIKALINKNRNLLIKETFRNKSNMYANFANTGQLLEEAKSCCRLWGYYVDGGRKSKSISYNFDVNTFEFQDDLLFDFIPFAFCGDREAFFINDNCSLNTLIQRNEDLKNKVNNQDNPQGKNKDARKALFRTIQETADFIDYDVEVIIKNRDQAFFETMFIRKESIDILRAIKVYEPFCFSLKINENYYLNVQKKVMDCILNMVRTDELIELFLKQNSEYLVSQFITINRLICGGGESMNQGMKIAYVCAKKVAEKLPDNKRESYRQKLISAIVFKDYDRCCQIILQLSNYADVTFDFAFDLFEDFEKNKDIAYTFINALTKKKDANNGGEEA